MLRPNLTTLALCTWIHRCLPVLIYSTPQGYRDQPGAEPRGGHDGGRPESSRRRSQRAGHVQGGGARGGELGLAEHAGGPTGDAYVVWYTMLLEMRRRPRYMCAYKASLLGLVLFFLSN